MLQQSHIAIFYMLGIAQGLFFAVTLFFSRLGNRSANRYLCLFTLMLALGLFDYLLALQPEHAWVMAIRKLSWAREFLFGVFIYFYARELTCPERYPLQGRQWLHFVPAALHAVVLAPLVFVSPEMFRALVLGEGLETPFHRIWSFLLTDFRFFVEVFHLPLYLLLSYRLLLHHKARIKENFSYQESLNLNWLRNVIVGTLVVYIVWVLEDIFSIGLGVRVALGVTIVCLIYVMCYLGLRQPLIFVDKRYVDGPVGKDIAATAQLLKETAPQVEERRPTDSAEVVQDPKTPYENSSLSQSSSEALMQEIYDFMAASKIFLEPQLSLPQLADAIGVSVPYVSQAINQQTGQNFFDFVNHYRLEMVLSQLQDPQDLPGTILDLGLAAGFNSKSAFYAAFKRRTNKTPSQYRADALAQMAA